MTNWHLFSHGGVNILLDVPTGAVHVVDDLAAKVFPFLVAGHKQEELSTLLPGDDYSALATAWSQLQELVDRGMLLSPEPRFTQRPGGGRMKAMCLHVAHDCDLRCRYCFAGTGTFGGDRGLMELDTALKAVDMLLESAGRTCEIDFFGGEPLLNLDLVEQTASYARAQASKKGKVINLTLTTNAYALDRETRERVKAMGLDLVLSHDGRESVHNAMRPCIGGKNSYKEVTNNILEMVKDVGDRHYIRGTFTAHNIDFVEDIKHWLDLGLRRLSLEPVVAPPGTGLAITNEYLTQLKEQYWSLAQLALDFPEPFTFFHFLMDWEQGPCGAKRASGCGAGKEYISVDPKGDVYPCHQFVGQERWLLGNVFQGISRRDIQDEFAAVDLPNKEPCGDCWARYHCGGGCHANAWWANERLDLPWELGCELLKIRTQAALYLKVQQFLRNQLNEGDNNGQERSEQKAQ